MVMKILKTMLATIFAFVMMGTTGNVSVVASAYSFESEADKLMFATINACLQRLKSQYEAIRQREKKNPANLSDKANGAVKGRHTTAKPQPATILTQNKSNVKEALPQ